MIRKINGWEYEINKGADLRRADLHEANLQGADLRRADLQGADLQGADLQGADLHEADLRGANLQGADLRRADLQGADLRRADLREADLSGCKGLMTAKEWLKINFKTNKKGFIVYKAEGHTYHPAPDSWKNKKFIEEVVESIRTTSCGCGVNFATLDWIKKEFNSRLLRGEVKIRRMYLHWEDLADVIVPYNTDGKARCARLEKGRLIKTK